MCRKLDGDEMGLVSKPLNPDANPWIKSNNIARVVPFSYPPYPLQVNHNYIFCRLLPPHHHQQYFHEKMPPTQQAVVSLYNVEQQPVSETTQMKICPRVGRAARKICRGGDGGWKMIETYECSVGPHGGFNKARWINGSYGGTKVEYWGRKTTVCENGKSQYSRGCQVGDGAAPAVDVAGSGRTTVMIKNIPNKFRREMLLWFLDKYCMELNLEYDFIYLPMDFCTLDNLGYAFVNFTSACGATKLRKALSNYKWGVVPYPAGLVESKKTCQITWAKIQGKEALERHFRNSYFKCDRYDFLPVVFTPPRSGSNSTSVTMTPVGKCGQLTLSAPS